MIIKNAEEARKAVDAGIHFLDGLTSQQTQLFAKGYLAALEGPEHKAALERAEACEEALIKHLLNLGYSYEGAEKQANIVINHFLNQHPMAENLAVYLTQQTKGQIDKNLVYVIEQALDEAEKRGAERMMSEEICMHLLQCPQCQEFSKIADNWKSLAGELLLSLIDAEESSHAEFCGMGCHNMKEHLEKIPIIAKAREMGLT